MAIEGTTMVLMEVNQYNQSTMQKFFPPPHLLQLLVPLLLSWVVWRLYLHGSQLQLIVTVHRYCHEVV